jgi:hypothetical protein
MASVTPSGDREDETSDPARFAFAVTADIREWAGPLYDEPSYFRGALEAIAALGGTDFMVSPGDIDPPPNILWTITRTLGTTYPWYPVVGNHELPGGGNEISYGSNMVWLRAYDKGLVNPGPSGCPTTTYSFDYQNAHLVMLNEYCDIYGDDLADGNVTDHLYDWLTSDLDATRQPHIFVFGHEPAYPQPDADNGRLRHEDDSLNRYPEERDRFWRLLRESRVTAYICGHTHNYSTVWIDGVWQVDVGHARGLGDTGAPSTFVIISIDDLNVAFDVYRAIDKGVPYNLMHSGRLAADRIYLPYVPGLPIVKPTPPWPY